MKYTKALVAGLIFLFSTASANNPPIHNPVPGGIAVVDIGARANHSPAVFFGQQEILTLEFGQRWIALVGISQDTVPGRYLLKIQEPEAETRIRG